MVVPLGATPFIIKSKTPNGGVVKAISRSMSMRMANQYGSMPRAVTTGTKSGIVIIIMEI